MVSPTISTSCSNSVISQWRATVVMARHGYSGSTAWVRRLCSSPFNKRVQMGPGHEMQKKIQEYVGCNKPKAVCLPHTVLGGCCFLPQTPGTQKLPHPNGTQGWVLTGCKKKRGANEVRTRSEIKFWEPDPLSLLTKSLVATRFRNLFRTVKLKSFQRWSRRGNQAKQQLQVRARRQKRRHRRCPCGPFPIGTPRFGTRSCHRHLLQHRPSSLIICFPMGTPSAK